MELRLAFDKASVRSYDGVGRLHVERTHISKANVRGYLGREIPRAEQLGLNPTQLYKLYCDPAELEKSVPTWNGIQLVIKHVPINTMDTQADKVVGALGTDATFNAPYLDNSISVWDAAAIAGIENKTQTELSAGYHYHADMTPGRTPEGEAYDGVMRKIRGNHVALVVDGRAGDDVVVGDEALNLEKEQQMKKTKGLSTLAAFAQGALTVSLAPRLAMDAKLNLHPMLEGVSTSNWKEKKPHLLTALKALPVTLFKDKPAYDAAMSDVVGMLDSLDANKPNDDLGEDQPDKNLEGVEDRGGTMEDALGRDSPNMALLAYLKDKLSPEDYAKCEEMLRPAEDDADGDMDVEDFVQNLIAAARAASKSKNIGKDTNAPPTPSKENKDMIDKPAMDAALKEMEQRTIQRMQNIEQARAEVRPYIGEVSLALDSAEAIYKLALDEAKVDLTGIPPAAYRGMLRLVPTADARKQTTIRVRQVAGAELAFDAAAVTGLEQRFGAGVTSRVKQL